MFSLECKVRIKLKWLTIEVTTTRWHGGILWYCDTPEDPSPRKLDTAKKAVPEYNVPRPGISTLTLKGEPSLSDVPDLAGLKVVMKMSKGSPLGGGQAPRSGSPRASFGLVIPEATEQELTDDEELVCQWFEWFGGILIKDGEKSPTRTLVICLQRKMPRRQRVGPNFGVVWYTLIN